MKNEIILITGYAGSLGTAFTKHLLLLGHEIIGVDNNEWAVASFGRYDNLTQILGDYSEQNYPKVDVVIHCAAYKHVDLGESNSWEFVENNVNKYKRFLDKIKTDKLLFISTDKAVEPISVYGYTKAIGEALTRQNGGVVARCGNFLSSSGSVIPLWEGQIERSEPISITDERMTRYVIDLQSAVVQIWQQFRDGLQLIVPEMGEPKKLIDILGEVLKRQGFGSVDSYAPGIKIIGIRDGEKLEEKLKWEHEE